MNKPTKENLPKDSNPKMKRTLQKNKDHSVKQILSKNKDQYARPTLLEDRYHHSEVNDKHLYLSISIILSSDLIYILLMLTNHLCFLFTNSLFPRDLEIIFIFFGLFFLDLLDFFVPFSLLLFINLFPELLNTLSP